MYKINDRVEVRRQEKTYTATVTKGPFKVPGEKLLHYHAKWDHEEHETIETIFSTKYNYRLSHQAQSFNIKKMTQEHKNMLGKHLITLGYKLTKDKSGKTIDDVIGDMKNIFIQIKKLKEHYGKLERISHDS